jgi:hypothetical protein
VVGYDEIKNRDWGEMYMSTKLKKLVESGYITGMRLHGKCVDSRQKVDHNY